MDTPGDYLKKRAQQLNLGRADTIAKAQALFERLFPAQTRVLSLNGGVLKVVTPNASVASELRLRQVWILEQMATADSEIKRLQIQIRQL